MQRGCQNAFAGRTAGGGEVTEARKGNRWVVVGHGLLRVRDFEESPVDWGDLGP